jgi:hypothetical protein
VATLDKIYALSPEHMEEFIQRFERALEMGTLTPMLPYSTVPAAFVRQVTLDKGGRVLIPAGLIVTIFLLVLVGLGISGKASVSLGMTLLARFCPCTRDTLAAAAGLGHFALRAGDGCGDLSLSQTREPAGGLAGVERRTFGPAAVDPGGGASVGCFVGE